MMTLVSDKCPAIRGCMVEHFPGVPRLACVWHAQRAVRKWLLDKKHDVTPQ